MTINQMSYMYTAKTSRNVYPLEIGFAHCKASDLVFQPEMVWGLCETGCKNYGSAGGCPPHAPRFDHLCHSDDDVWLVYAKFLSKYKSEKVANSKNIALHWKSSDAILSRFLLKLARGLVINLGGSFLSTGYCMGCPGKKCNYKLGNSTCRNPHQRTFSMEATGLNVVETIKNIFGIPLYWYSKDNTNIPYMLKCIAFMPTSRVTDIDIKNSLTNTLQFHSMDNKIPSEELPAMTMLPGLENC